MKIVSWNCHGRFRDKYPLMQGLNADIYIIQECENPQKHKVCFAGAEKNSFWCGENDSRGLGVFARKEIQLEINPWEKYCLRNFLSLKINDSFNLLCVWAGFPYIEEYYIYQAINYCHYSADMIIMGDFNSNARWDRKNNKRSHGEVVRSLQRLGLVSAYHYFSGEPQGLESKHTFYMHFDKNKGYHIDHCFAAPDRMKHFEILDPEQWLAYSDHVPIILEI